MKPCTSYRRCAPPLPTVQSTLLTLALALLVGCDGAPLGAPSGPPPNTSVSREALRFDTEDGETLFAQLRRVGPPEPKPVIVEFSPYGMGSDVPDFGPDYHHVFVHARGTGNSTGSWSAVGPRDQQDVAEFVAWACEQPWSNGRIGLYGFSASAIAVYNALHLPLACVEAAALMAGTADLYRDLLYPGGMPNLVPAVAVGLGVGGPLLASTPNRLMADFGLVPLLRSGLGLLSMSIDVLGQPVQNDYWQERVQRPGPNRFPILANTGFYDVESRGPFESYQMLRDQGVTVHLRALGAHDGFPSGTEGPFPTYQRWFDRFLRDVNNGIDREPPVQLLLSDGSYPSMMKGAWLRAEGADWPLPGTRWQSLYLDPVRGGGAASLNNASLSPQPAAINDRQRYLALTSLGTASDPNTTATIASAGASTLFDLLPFLVQMNLMEPLGLTYTTAPLAADVTVLGPATLSVFVSGLLPQADLHAVIADVWPDGSAHTVGLGRLRTSFPNLVEPRSRHDAEGELIQPYNDFSSKSFAAPGEVREYHVEFWPIGNRFRAGHRLRLYLVGAPTFALPSPNFNTVHLGGDTPSRLRLPVAPGSDFCAALPDRC